MIAGLAALCGLAAYAIFSEAAHSNALDARVRSLSAQNAGLEQQIAERQRQIGAADGRAWLEGQARRLGFVYPGETVFIITTPGAALPASGGINAVLPTYAPVPAGTPTPTAGPSPTASAGASATASPTPAPSPTPVTFGGPSPTPH